MSDRGTPKAPVCVLSQLSLGLPFIVDCCLAPWPWSQLRFAGSSRARQVSVFIRQPPERSAGRRTGKPGGGQKVFVGQRPPAPATGFARVGGGGTIYDDISYFTCEIMSKNERLVPLYFVVKAARPIQNLPCSRVSALNSPVELSRCHPWLPSPSPAVPFSTSAVALPLNGFVGSEWR